MATKRITKKEKRRLLLVSFITLGLITLIAYSLFSTWKQILDMKKDKEFLTKQLQEMKDEEAYLKVEVEKLKDPDYIARYAREKYLYSKDGEFNIRIP
jgi:cell division protein DivIC